MEWFVKLNIWVQIFISILASGMILFSIIMIYNFLGKKRIKILGATISGDKPASVRDLMAAFEARDKIAELKSQKRKKVMSYVFAKCKLILQIALEHFQKLLNEKIQNEAVKKMLTMNYICKFELILYYENIKSFESMWEAYDWEDLFEEDFQVYAGTNTDTLFHGTSTMFSHYYTDEEYIARIEILRHNQLIIPEIKKHIYSMFENARHVGKQTKNNIIKLKSEIDGFVCNYEKGK